MSRPATSRSISRPKSSTSAHAAPAAAAPAPAPRSPSPLPSIDYSLAAPALTPSQLRILEKQQEHAGLQALKEASGALVARVEELARMGNVMADGGEAVGSVMRNWPLVFSILGLVDQPKAASPADRDASDDADATAEDADLAESRPLPQLVRLKFTEEGKDKED